MTARKPFVRSPGRPDLPPSLANAAVGEEVRVRRILLHLVRVMCNERGIAVGDRLLVEERSEGDVRVRDENGRAARLPDPYAFFVQVTFDDGERPA